MSPHGRQLNELQKDLWRENETTLRQLYLKERRTLKDVKRIMENERGFPMTPSVPIRYLRYQQLTNM
jgi:hypothetical protein